MEQEGILASLTIAQAILESTSGTSELAVKANNLFGIKHNSTWTGGKYDKKTKEFVNGKEIEIVASFCKFSSLEECLKYRSTIFLKRDRYKPIWGVKDYKVACQKIYECGYATDPKYPQKLIKVIEDNKLYNYDKESVKMPSYVVSSGHSLYVSGANKHLIEVTEARKVTDKVVQLLKQAGSTAQVFHDNTSRDKNTNVKTIVNFHNGKSRDIDISIHFNAGGGHGVEVLYYEAHDLAKKVSSAISKASGLKDRGAKKRTDLYFLRNTKKPALLIEVCFVDSVTDTAIYKNKFNQICEAIVEALTGKKVSPTPTPAPAPPKVKKIVTIVDNLRYYKTASWLDKDVAGTVKKGAEFELIEKVKVGTAEQYKFKTPQGVIYYITASAKYVKVV